MYRAGLMVPGLGELHQRLVTRFVIRCIGRAHGTQTWGAASKVSDTVCDSMYRAGLMVPGLGELHQRLVTRFVIRCIGQGSWFPDLGSCIKG